MELRDYQKETIPEAIKILKELNLLVLNFDMRTGKTIICLEICRQMGLSKILFISKKWAIPSIETDADKMGMKVTTINYESLHRVKGDFDVIIADEYHHLGYIQRPSKKAKLFKMLSGRLPVIGLTGTLFTETFSTAYSLFSIEFSEHNDFYSWFKIFGIPGKKFFHGRSIEDYSKCRKEDFWPRIQKYCLSLTQKEAGFECKIVDVIHFVESPRMREFIAKVKKDRYHKFSDGQELILDTAAKKFQVECQLVSGTVKTGKDKYKLLTRHKTETLKSDFVGKKKFAVYYKYVAEKLLIMQELESPFCRITEDWECFQRTGNEVVFLGQYQSKMEGIRLDAADDVVFFSMPFSNLQYLQSRQRIASKEKTQELRCHIIMSGIEEFIYDVVVKHKGKFNLEMYKQITRKKK